MTDDTERDADYIDMKLCALNGRAEAAGMFELADAINAARRLARRNMNKKQLEEAPW